jgi:hypothetical protein
MKIIVHASLDRAQMAAGCAVYAATHDPDTWYGGFKLIKKGPYMFAIKKNKGGYSVWDKTSEEKA